MSCKANSAKNLKIRVKVDIEFENFNGEFEEQVMSELSKFARQAIAKYEKHPGSVILEFELDSIAALRLDHAINQGRFFDLKIVSSLIVEQEEKRHTSVDSVIEEIAPVLPGIWYENEESEYNWRKRPELLRRPIILINADYRSAQRGQPSFSVLTAGYYDCIFQAGAMPLIAPPCYDKSRLVDLLKLVDGVVMIGGADLDPRRDGFMLHPAVRPMDPRRESFDRSLASLVVEKRIPVFGIGVGMQLLNVVSGGNLFLHIPEDLAKAIPHRDPLDPGHRHSLEVSQDSLMGRVYGDGEVRVNSQHHMAIDEVAPGFRVTARCPDGVVEAIESINPEWFALGTQFHPETESASALDMRIFEEFVDGVCASTAQSANKKGFREN